MRASRHGHNTSRSSLPLRSTSSERSADHRPNDSNPGHAVCSEVNRGPGEMIYRGAARLREIGFRERSDAGRDDIHYVIRRAYITGRCPESALGHVPLPHRSRPAGLMQIGTPAFAICARGLSRLLAIDRSDENNSSPHCQALPWRTNRRTAVTLAMIWAVRLPNPGRDNGTRRSRAAPSDASFGLSSREQ